MVSTCATCKHRAVTNTPHCRRYPPTIVGNQVMFPPVPEGFSCGEYRRSIWKTLKKVFRIRKAKEA